MSLDVPCGWRCRAHRAHSSETSFDKPASRRDAMSNIFLRCIYVPVARSKHVSIHTFMVHRGGPAVCSLGALGGLRFLPERPRGFGISVLHRRVRTIVCVRLVLAAINPRLRQDAERVLNSGGTVSFGKISLSPAGVVWKSKEPIPYAALVKCKIDGSILRVKAEGKWLDNIAVTAKKVPNVFILLDLIEEKRSTAPGKTTVAMAGSSANQYL